MNIVLRLFAACLMLLASFAQANDFPTLVRVEYVFSCMQENDDENYDTLYRCVCIIDTIAEHFAYQDYAEATTFSMLRRTPGEKGGLFRDPPQAQVLREKLERVNANAKTRCLAD